MAKCRLRGRSRSGTRGAKAAGICTISKGWRGITGLSLTDDYPLSAHVNQMKSISMSGTTTSCLSLSPHIPITPTLPSCPHCSCSTLEAAGSVPESCSAHLAVPWMEQLGQGFHLLLTRSISAAPLVFTRLQSPTLPPS